MFLQRQRRFQHDLTPYTALVVRWIFKDFLAEYRSFLIPCVPMLAASQTGYRVLLALFPYLSILATKPSIVLRSLLCDSLSCVISDSIVLNRPSTCCINACKMPVISSVCSFRTVCSSFLVTVSLIVQALYHAACANLLLLYALLSAVSASCAAPLYCSSDSGFLAKLKPKALPLPVSHSTKKD